jgi:hypothetical protein
MDLLVRGPNPVVGNEKEYSNNNHNDDNSYGGASHMQPIESPTFPEQK